MNPRPQKKAGIGEDLPFYFGFLVVVLYLVCGVYLLFSERISLEKTYRYLLSGLIIVYGTIRFFRILKKWKGRHQQNEVKNEELFL